MKILIIEDDESIRLTLQDLLELNGHTVLAAATGPEGLDLARDQPEMIICDIGLPGLDGHQVLAAIREMPECRQVTFIFLTARVERGEMRRGMAGGADDYITKPFTERDILEAIAARVQRLRPLRERMEALFAEKIQTAEADWSHNLLTPLNAIMGGLELIDLEADSIQPADLRELLGLIRNGAERQHELATKLIRYFDLERQSRSPTARTDRGLASDAIASGAKAAMKAAQREADLVLRCAPASVALNETSLSAALGELVSNACSFSKPGQPVTVTGGEQSGRYVITIADQGPGMTAEQRASVGPFRQFDRKRFSQHGLGLGLATVRLMAELAGGRLALAAGPEGRGLVATLELPLAPDRC